MCGCCAVTLLTYRMIVECEEEQNIGRATDGAWSMARGNGTSCLYVCVVTEGFLS